MDIFSQILTRYWGYASFRPLQREIIESVAKGKDTLGLMPTGGGKSVTFQVYSLSRPGICIVITPLIALMKDQVEKLKSLNIKALAVHSGMSGIEMKVAVDNAVWGDYKFLYVSPERLQSERFVERLTQMQVNLIVIDEAHCISQWGYDFRPSYLNIAEIRKIVPEVPVLALTATATDRVVDDIQDKLNFKKRNVLKVSFQRNNLEYIVRQVEDKTGYLLRTLKKTKGSGIVYARSRKKTREIAFELKKNGISADFYHAGLNNRVRSEKQDRWIAGKVRVIVATNAFGMGIDKPDVRFVVHYHPPESLEAYFQEAGRAGRDGKRAVAAMLYNTTDKARLKSQVAKAFPEVAEIKRVYHSLCNYLKVAEGFGNLQSYAFSVPPFAQAFKLGQAKVYNSLKILQREGYLEFTEEVDQLSRIYFMVSRDDLYRFQVENTDFDDFIKLILRSYTGLFSGYVNIDEDLLASRAGIDRDIIYQYLKLLRRHKIIDYVPQNSSPFIYFTKERLPIARLKISKENYDVRKTDMRRRIDAVIHYVTSTIRCRSQMLLDYFGEKDAPPCGTCDVCKSLSAMLLTTFEFENISKTIEKLLEKPLTYEKLLLKLKGDQQKMRQVIKWLSDNGKIIYRIDNQLEWNNS
ncbi:MAG: recombinase RecQ [Draconibacterium sp.]|nr:MAG: recombinase RecQ [Draconibacterium sp.]